MEQESQRGPLGPDVAVTNILVVTDPARSRDFWVNVLGAELYREYGGTSTALRFLGTWLRKHCRMGRCTSRSGTPASRAAVMNAAECAARPAW